RPWQIRNRFQNHVELGDEHSEDFAEEIVPIYFRDIFERKLVLHICELDKGIQIVNLDAQSRRQSKLMLGKTFGWERRQIVPIFIGSEDWVQGEHVVREELFVNRILAPSINSRPEDEKLSDA